MFLFLNLELEFSQLSLLSLLPPSCIVVPVREIVNKHFLFSSTITSNPTMAQIPSNIDIDVNIDNIANINKAFKNIKSEVISDFV